MSKREALRNLRREAKMVRAYQDREEEAMLIAREHGATMREIGDAIGMTTGGVSSRLRNLA